ncbi:MAG: alpha-2-macroglobulin family protein [Nibricoccus sp.]
MNTRLLKGVSVCLVLALNVFAGPTDRSEQWAEVEKAQANGQPQTALEKLEPIITGAYSDLLYAEAIRALALKMAIEDRVNGNGAERKIVRFQAEIEKAPAAMKPAMEAVLAHWYWQYYQQNRWRFMQRTQTAESPGADIQTWDLARILTEIDKHFTAALADEATLKKTPIHVYRQLLEPGNVPESYRPTLFDFLAHEALKFYQAGEHAQLKAEDEFEIAATSPIFGDVREFMAWQPAGTDDASPKLKAIHLYQALLKFHADDPARDAFFDTDLDRLEYGKNVAFGDDAIDRYKTALERFIVNTSAHGISARALALLAMQFQQEGEPAKAREIAQRGLKAFPSSTGGAMCYNLIQQIEAKSAQLHTESVWNAPWPTLDLTYRNVRKVFFRAIPADFAKRIKQDRDEKDLLTEKPVLEWEADLPPTADFKERTEKIPAPTTLKPGYYLIAASHNPSFGDDNNQVSATFVWVSDLALVLRLRYDSETQSGLVVRAGSGEPVSGAVISIWKENRYGDLAPGFSSVTNDNGLFEFSSIQGSCFIMAEAEGQKVATGHGVYVYGRDSKDGADTQTVFFTDRAIYRPGQTINYKGVSIRYDREMGKYSVLSGHKLTVVFNDPNGKEIARAGHRTNDYGSFSGTFTAPRDRLTGQMTIQVLGRPSQTSVSVEEYKRPKFQVEIATPTEAAKLDAPVELTGKATAYNGAAIGGAKVKWRVERGVQLPYWCWWWQPMPSKAIAHGTAVTEPDGTFKVQFPTTPDRSVPAKNEPVFVFTVHADVTDTTGETRSDDRAVRAGYTALQATLSAEDWQTAAQPAELAISTSSLDGDPQAASGKVIVHALKQPAAVERAPLQRERFWWHRAEEPGVDLANPDSWALGDVVSENSFSTDASGKTELKLPLKAGIYRVLLETKDRFGKTVTARRTVEVVDPSQLRYTVKIPNKLAAEKWSVEPGETFTALWGTGYDKGRAFVELECNGEPLKTYWTVGDRTQDLIKLPVKEAHRGGFTLRVTHIHENRAYTTERVVNVPWTNKQLAVKWETFRSKLAPGQKETWSAVITGPDAKRVSAEMAVALYDASLDQYAPHHWLAGFGVFRSEQNRTRTEFQNTRQYFRGIYNWGAIGLRDTKWQYSSFVPELSINNHVRYGSLGAQNDGGMDGDVVVLSPFAVAVTSHDVGYRASNSLVGSLRQRGLARERAPAGISIDSFGDIALPEAKKAVEEAGAITKQTRELLPDLSKVTARKNLNETAFFFPQLTSDENGVVKMTFTMPEALTEWKFLGFVYDKQLRSGLLTDKVTTSKDLMVEPNPPRFVREGDTIEFTVKVSNQSDQPQKGTVKLTLADAASLKSADDALGNRAVEQSFDVPAKQSRSYAWRIAVPDGLGFLTYKAVAATAQFSDGEEGFLPVLSRRILVTESLPLPIRGKATKKFELEKLLASGKSDTLRHQSLTVQMTSQPAWYAVMALPYLMEFPHECSEQLFNRLYANALARHIANSDPKIRRIFDLWKNTPALDSPLEKNQDLKSLMLEETPWWREATVESQARRSLGLLFESNRLDDEAARALKQLAERQQSDGLWAWFPGGRSSEYISRYIVTGFGRLRHLGVQIDVSPAVKALAALDAALAEDYREILKRDRAEDYVPTHLDALTLYGRSFFLKDRPVANEHQAAVDFFLRQARKFWTKSEDRQRLAHLAIALQRFGDAETPRAIMKSLKERSLNTEEMGMHWRDAESGWWWYQAPIETQALMIEAFAEVTNDAQAVEDCKVWLLKQKQTQNWKTTKATADAVYGLLLRGTDLLASDALVEVSLGGEAIKPEKVEAGTGFYEQKFVRSEIKPAMGAITVKKTDGGVSWGSVHWQYLEDMSKVTPHEATPLKLKKSLWIKETTSKGQVLKPVSGPMSVGDELVVRIELRVDRDMEYVHLKDQRGSGTEPVNVLSRYRWQDSLGYYESTRDTASHFFIDYLRRGTYVFEYSTRVQLKGVYQTGIAEIQCMYAPEFNSHSESILLEVK